jgi:hypothetical protein
LALRSCAVVAVSSGITDNCVVGARNNIVIDTNVCRQDVINQGVDALNAIAAKVIS